MDTINIEQNKKPSIKERINAALVEILKTAELSDITVAMLINKAGVSKSTFYRNYHDVFEVYECMVDEFIKRAARVVVGMFVEESISFDDVKETVNEEVFSPDAFSFDENDTFVFKKTLECGDVKVLTMFYSKLYETISHAFKNRFNNSEERQFYCGFLIKAFISCYIADMSSGRKFDIDLLNFAFGLVSTLKTEEVVKVEDIK